MIINAEAPIIPDVHNAQVSFQRFCSRTLECAVIGTTHLQLQAHRTIHVLSSFVPSSKTTQVPSLMNWMTLFGEKYCARMYV